MIRMYETIFIVQPELVDDELKGLTTKVQDVVTTMKGDLRKLDDWGLRKLAYPIDKFNRGRYFYLRSDGDAAMIAELERRLRLDDKVIRYQTVKLEKETVATAAAQPAAPEAAVAEEPAAAE